MPLGLLGLIATQNTVGISTLGCTVAFYTALAVGSRRQTTWSVVLMASGNAAITSASFVDSVRTLSATIAAELAEVVFGGAHYAVLVLALTMLLGLLLDVPEVLTGVLGLGLIGASIVASQQSRNARRRSA